MIRVLYMLLLTGCISSNNKQTPVVPTTNRTIDPTTTNQTVAVANEAVNQLETNDMTSLLVFVWLVVAVVGTVCLTMIFNRLCGEKKTKCSSSSAKATPVYYDKTTVKPLRHVIREQNNTK